MEFLTQAWQWLMAVPNTWAFWFWATYGFLTANYLTWCFIPNGDHHNPRTWHHRMLTFGTTRHISTDDDGENVAWPIIYCALAVIVPIFFAMGNIDSKASVWLGFTNWVIFKMALSGVMAYAGTWSIAGSLIGLKTLSAIAWEKITARVKSIRESLARQAAEEQKRRDAAVEASKRKPENILARYDARVKESHAILGTDQGLNTAPFINTTASVRTILEKCLSYLSIGSSRNDTDSLKYFNFTVASTDSLYPDSELRKYAQPLLDILASDATELSDFRLRAKALVEAAMTFAENLSHYSELQRAQALRNDLVAATEDLQADLPLLGKDDGRIVALEARLGEILESNHPNTTGGVRKLATE